jgi:hypothetical protein
MVDAVGAPVMAASDTDIESAKAAIKEGRARRSAGDYQGARDQFKAAWALVPTPRNGVELAEAYEALGELVEARRIYVDVTKLPPLAKESPESKEARKKADDAAASLLKRIPSITIRLENIPKGASPRVSVDDADVPVDALAVPRMVNPGKHVVLVKLDGSQPKKSAFELSAGQTRVVTVDLTPDAVTESPKPTAPPAKVGATPTAAASPSTPAPTTRNSDSGVTSSGPSTMTWVGFSVGGAGVLIGGVTGILALGKDSTIKSNCPNQGCPPAFHSDLDAAKRYSTISTISFGVGLVGIGVGVWGLLSSPSAEATKPATSASVQPWIGIGTVGVTGAF